MDEKNPFALTQAHQQSGGSLAQIQSSRAVAEAYALYQMAALMPRNQVQAMDRILNACTRPSLAERATYEYSRGGTDISGPSIRLAETIAQQWGNIKFGFREVSRGTDDDGIGYSEIEAYATDLETRVPKEISFRVRHWRDTKKGGYALKDERDIYELMANMASRRVRNCILSIVPGDVVEMATKQCDMTLRTKVDVSAEAVQKMVEAFAMFGVRKEQIEKRIQRRIDSIQPAQIVQLRRIYASLADDMSSAEDWFDPIETPQAPQSKPKATGATETGAPATPKSPEEAPKETTKPHQTRVAPDDHSAAGAEQPTSASAGPSTISNLSEAQERILISRAKSAGYDVAALLQKFGSIDLSNLNAVLAKLKAEIDAQS